MLKCVKEYYLNDTFFPLTTCLVWSGKKFITRPRKKKEKKVAANPFMEWHLLTLRAFCIQTQHTGGGVAAKTDHPATKLCPLPFTGRGSAPFLKAACHFVYITHGSQQWIVGTPNRKGATTRKPLLCSCGLGDTFPGQPAGVIFNRTTETPLATQCRLPLLDRY